MASSAAPAPAHSASGTAGRRARSKGAPSARSHPPCRRWRGSGGNQAARCGPGGRGRRAARARRRRPPRGRVCGSGRHAPGAGIDRPAAAWHDGACKRLRAAKDGHDPARLKRHRPDRPQLTATCRQLSHTAPAATGRRAMGQAWRAASPTAAPFCRPLVCTALQAIWLCVGARRRVQWTPHWGRMSRPLRGCRRHRSGGGKGHKQLSSRHGQGQHWTCRAKAPSRSSAGRVGVQRRERNLRAAHAAACAAQLAQLPHLCQCCYWSAGCCCHRRE